MPRRETAPLGAPCWVDLLTTKIAGLGGTIVRAAEDTPYGRLATATDATGAEFKLVAPNEAMPARNSSN